MKYNIIPKQFVADNLEAANADEAMSDFAMKMDTDMNSYFKAVPSEENASEIVKGICNLLRSLELSSGDYSHIFSVLKEQGAVIGGKLWTTEDIQSQIQDNYGFMASEETLNEIANHVIYNYGDMLDDCRDYEWDAINNAIEDANLRVVISDIEWDVDSEDFDDEAEYDAVKENLPKRVEISLSSLESGSNLADYLSDNYGYCVKSFLANEKPLEKIDQD